MGVERARPVLTRSDSAKNRLDSMACITSGLIYAVSTNRVVLSSQRLSTPCFVGTAMRRSVMSFY
jgi:hypothetical protein